MWVQSLGQEDPLEKEMATHSNVLAQRIPWIKESGGLQFIGLQRVQHHRSDLARMHAWYPKCNGNSLNTCVTYTHITTTNIAIIFLLIFPHTFNILFFCYFFISSHTSDFPSGLSFFSAWSTFSRISFSECLLLMNFIGFCLKMSLFYFSFQRAGRSTIYPQ